ncbi:hypothetical protein Misp04_59190 [Micromonospora sp. NBRC 101691]|nr:hypothetical protein Misp04_59190 [Micromonospora sp. NBRC 101691]
MGFGGHHRAPADRHTVPATPVHITPDRRTRSRSAARVADRLRQQITTPTGMRTVARCLALDVEA